MDVAPSLQIGYIKLRGKKGYDVETEWWSHLPSKRLSTEGQNHVTRKIHSGCFYCVKALSNFVYFNLKKIDVDEEILQWMMLKWLHSKSSYKLCCLVGVHLGFREL